MAQNDAFGSMIVIPGYGSGEFATATASAGTAPPVRQLNDEWKRWVAENVLLNKPPRSIVDTLIKSGYDPVVSQREVDSAMAHPYIRAAAEVVAAGGNAAPGAAASRIAKRDWVLALQRRSDRLDTDSNPVPVVHKPSREQFLHEFYAPNRPCLIEGAMDDWPAMKLWTLDYLRDKLGDKTVEVQMGRERDANYEINSGAHKKQMPFREYVDLVEKSGKTNDFYITANNSGVNRDALAALWDDIVLFPDYLRNDDPGNRGFFWFGPQGIVTPLHHDLTNNFMAQVVGRKLVRLMAPYELPNIYNFRHCFSRVDPSNPDYEKFPLFRNVRVIDVMLNPGQILFLPIGWWHHVTGVDISITMTFTGFVFDNDFSSFYTTYNDID